MATLTGLQIINSALRKTGEKSPTGTQQDNALIDLNSLLSNWSVDGLMVPYLTWENFSLVAGTGSYTIGSGATFNTVRPVKIISAYLLDSNSLRYGLEVNMSVQEYNRNTQPTTRARPTQLHYLPGYANGTIYFDVLPDAAYTLYIQTEKPLTEITNTGTAYSIPDEYKLALIYNLAILVSHDDDNQLANDVIAVAISSKAAIERNNIRVNPARMDTALQPLNEPYNINEG